MCYVAVFIFVLIVATKSKLLNLYLLIQQQTQDNLIIFHLILQATGNNCFLIDGFPRNEDNLTGWTKQMAGKVNEQFVLFFDGPNEVFIDRCLKRGQAGSGRVDDNLDSLQKRLVTYENDTKPIIEHYRKQGLVNTIDACESPDIVFEKVKSCFEKVKGASNGTTS